MEEIFVLYSVEESSVAKVDRNLDQYLNCLPLQVEKGKEVLLMDIINQLLTRTQLSANYSFRIDVGDGESSNAYLSIYLFPSPNFSR